MDKELAKKMGNIIGKRLFDLNMTQKDLANLVGTNTEQINYICCGKRIPKVDAIPLFAKALQCNIEYLYGNETISSSDNEIRDIGKYTGLSEYSIKTLHKYKIEDNVYLYKNPISCINLLIEQDSLGALESIEFIKHNEMTEDEYREIYTRISKQNNDYNKNHVTNLFQHISDYLNSFIDENKTYSITSKGCIIEPLQLGNSYSNDEIKEHQSKGDFVSFIQSKDISETILLNKVIDDIKRLKKIREEEHYNVKKTNK